MFLILHEYRAEKKATIVKKVICEACAMEYIYPLSCTAEGHGATLFGLDNEGAARRADLAADNELIATFEREVEVRPCPRCGHFQAAMVLKARADRYYWLTFGVAFVSMMVLTIVGVLSYCLASPLRGPSPLSLRTWAIVMACGNATLFSMPVLRIYLLSSYDPNHETEEQRRRRGVVYPPGEIYEADTRGETGIKVCNTGIK